MPLNRKGKARTKTPKFQHHVTLCVLQHKCQGDALEKQCIKKNKKKAAEYAEFWLKRLKEAKEK